MSPKSLMCAELGLLEDDWAVRALVSLMRSLFFIGNGNIGGGSYLKGVGYGSVTLGLYLASGPFLSEVLSLSLLPHCHTVSNLPLPCAFAVMFLFCSQLTILGTSETTS